MTEHGYSVLAEYWGEVPVEKIDHITDVLVEAVLPHAGAVSVGSTGVDLRFSLVYDQETSVDQVVGDGVYTAQRAIEETGLDLHLEAIGVQSDAALERELATPNFPELVGLSEIADILGVSRQRVAQLRERDDFPKPVAELRSGPVWARPMLDRFVDEWPRRSGHARTWDPEQAQELLESTAGSDLTERELKILQLMAFGGSTTELAERLGISSEAFRSATRRIFGKLKVESKAEQIVQSAEPANERAHS